MKVPIYGPKICDNEDIASSVIISAAILENISNKIIFEPIGLTSCQCQNSWTAQRQQSTNAI
jgi:hypothetical protein